jgi:D-sedoheptulose 7-phosphate isomerase
MNTDQFIINKINEAIELKKKILEDKQLISALSEVSEILVSAFQHKGKVLLCGNGGSAADAQHIAAELSGKFYKDRPPLYAEALHVNTSYLTSVANDYSFDEVYSRMIYAMGNPEDVLIAISTSGNSKNIINAVKTANKKQMITIGFSGESGGDMNQLCKYMVRVPSKDTPRIQEAHILIGHLLCELIETKLFP